MNDVTLGEVYRALGELKEAVDSHQATNELAHQELMAAQKVTNGRVSKLERWQSFMLGTIAMGAALNLPQRIFDLLIGK